jgi:phosphatidylglycerophosphate synthase
VSRLLCKTRLPLRLLAGTLGVLLLTHLVRRAGPANLLQSMATLGWRLGLVVALGGVSHLVKTWAWRLALLGEKRQASFGRMLGLRLGSEAVGQLGILGQMFGESLRVALLSPTVSLAGGIASVTLDRAFSILTAAVVTIAGMIALLAVLPLPHTLSLYAGLCALTLLGVVAVMALAVRKRWPVFSGAAQALGRVRYFSGWIEHRHSLIHSVESKLLDFYHHTPGAFWGSFVLNLACHGAAVLEVYLILHLMGANTSLVVALTIEALTKLVNIVGVFNPGNVGTYEGGNVLIGKLFGLSGAAGLTLGLARRFRGIFWAAVGGICLVMFSKAKKRSNFENPAHATIRVPASTASVTEAQNGSQPVGRSHVAVILADNLHGDGSFGSALPKVGALPILLRAILGEQKAGAARIIVVVNGAEGPWLQRELETTGRLPRSVEWFHPGAGEASLCSLFSQIADEGAGPLVLMAGDRTYHPSLHRRAAEWNEEGDALVLATASRPVGMYALSRNVITDLAMRCPRNVHSLEELQAWLTATYSMEWEPVEESNWQIVRTPLDRALAEQKLNRWLVKPTDGIFARMNRRVSIPISRQLIKFPITPNMVSLFTLGVSFTSGVCFAVGGYGNMLLGAVLSLFASILDGCDGEVARLTFQESAFGCWLETICDYLYYLFIFAGMTIGLLRSSGMRTYLAWGGLLLFGAVLSFLVTGLQRHRITTGRPEQYLAIWQRRAVDRRFNPLLYIGRHTEFIIRRCFLPYALLFFAVFNITHVAFILSALGVNLVWLIALYSYRTFAAGGTPTAAGPLVSA